MKTLRGKQYYFKEQNDFTMVNKVLEAPASNINDSLTRVQCFLLSLPWGDFEQR
jgi:hypothetical protein